ncbi:fumarylacetoacetate hydrolase family protein [Halopenitus persicus]|uniref:2-keto-4-pentenoate hydratase/2-oxohepta-3-ene-1,7-dioic acid hydratase (Catechol pathway) n=1 Tax=Halopenitus persicus TaxID=1048396 RepID=A0A1H3MAK1_9EURY|nr:fumarylacetoacetate hydrolase family protein [Halopenitus persicus]SDY73613.1 2-keto-4-pentenoate hydratase/2-oxohepta-3-ene-1,7-dioic acid hydratase (catechol pathway) [Halopenitus persicus]
MRQARLLTPDGPVAGRYEDGTIHADDGVYEVGVDGRLLPPCEPSALYCVGRNYAETLDQMAYERPAEPDFFIKPPTSLLGHGQPIPAPDWTDELTYAGELVAVIDRRCRALDPADVPDVVRGYTILNDVDALDQVGRTARKAFDGSAPLGPWIETDLADPTDVEMETIVAGERRQSANTELMLFDPFELVAHLSERFTLRPGDCIAFGSPANPGLIEPGDAVSITYEGVGTLENAVAEGGFP